MESINRDKPIKLYSFNIPKSINWDICEQLSDNPICEVMQSILCKVTDLQNEAIVEEVIKTAIEHNVDHLYLMDKKFVLDALKEKLIRDGYVGGDTNDVSTNSGDT